MPRAYKQEFSDQTDSARIASSTQTAAVFGEPDHRKEIDGLRAIAILAVMFHHFGVPGFGGGFVGVDIFFVISGFLIGGMLWREHQHTGRVALGSFLMRRIRRLAPAYFAMIFAVLVVGSWILLPNDFHNTAKGIMAATVFLSNVLFYGQSEPFDGAAEEQIMLHTWSLSVEEQFYVFLPLIFLVFARSARAICITLAACFAVSLLGSLLVVPQAQAAAFYLFPFRAWELLAGVGLAILRIERPDILRAHQALSWVGMSLLLVSICFMQASETFPGWQVVLPVLGTLLVIANGHQKNWVNHVLSMRVPVLIGLISYSLYLWHWPVYALTTYLQQSYAGPAETALWMAISFVLATLSWRLIEEPVRNTTQLANWSLLSAMVAASALAVSFSFGIYRTDGLPQRFDAQARLHIAASSDVAQDLSRCHTADIGAFKGLKVCPIGPQTREHTLIIWGDEHARAYLAGLDQAAQETQRSGLVIWREGCAPVFDIRKSERTTSQANDVACAEANQHIKTALQSLPYLRDVLLIGRWSYYADGAGIGHDAHKKIRLSSPTFGPMTQDRLLATALAATVNEIAVLDRDVFVLRQPPEFEHYHAPDVARALVHGRLPPQLAHRIGQISVTDANQRAAGAQAALQKSGAQIIDTWQWFCDPFLCDAVQAGVGQFFDNNLVTNAAAERMRAVFYPVMTRHPQ
ncbi:acyltransferase [Shimia sp. R10_1]|uniref:acyltransferase family protein n=1 Tax=Shimia sp. R10_1 TaxID=2821095 RepID=UPI001AD95566|nr:acyltransferase family protein [Shimia sp. R10_1]MBO9474050.1 acyltransferase [Shimia sp. R10_1]